jgi:NAD(P)-dependent dehydrogenase (short-subunit alcohol dehydrogenase family)
MKIVIVGASGKIGSKVVDALSDRHDIVRVGAHSGDVQCDYTDKQSIKSMYKHISQFDALISVAGGDSTFKPFEELEDEDYKYGFERKFLGQVKLVRHGMNCIRDNGSFTLTSGFLSHYPNPYSVATGPLNSAINTFVQNTALLLADGIRINVVSPAPVVEKGPEKKGLVTALQTAEMYVKAVEGNFTGQVLRAWGGLPLPEETNGLNNP